MNDNVIYGPPQVAGQAHRLNADDEQRERERQAHYAREQAARGDEDDEGEDLPVVQPLPPQSGEAVAAEHAPRVFRTDLDGTQEQLGAGDGAGISDEVRSQLLGRSQVLSARAAVEGQATGEGGGLDDLAVMLPGRLTAPDFVREVDRRLHAYRPLLTTEERTGIRHLEIYLQQCPEATEIDMQVMNEIIARQYAKPADRNTQRSRLRKCCAALRLPVVNDRAMPRGRAAQRLRSQEQQGRVMEAPQREQMPPAPAQTMRPETGAAARTAIETAVVPARTAVQTAALPAVTSAGGGIQAGSETALSAAAREQELLSRTGDLLRTAGIDPQEQVSRPALQALFRRLARKQLQSLPREQLRQLYDEAFAAEAEALLADLMGGDGRG